MDDFFAYSFGDEEYEHLAPPRTRSKLVATSERRDALQNAILALKK